MANRGKLTKFKWLLLLLAIVPLGYALIAFIIKDLVLFPGASHITVSDLSQYPKVQPYLVGLGLEGPIDIYTTERYRYTYYLIECKFTDGGIFGENYPNVFGFDSHYISPSLNYLKFFGHFESIGYEVNSLFSEPSLWYSGYVGENGARVDIVINERGNVLIRVFAFHR